MSKYGRFVIAPVMKPSCVKASPIVNAGGDEAVAPGASPPRASSGSRPVRMLGIDVDVHDECDQALANTKPSPASLSRLGDVGRR